nr:PREDICTED: tripartite motif-containing protein 47-like isoform X1 [Lepisosteus oculatus]
MISLLIILLQWHRMLSKCLNCTEHEGERHASKQMSFGDTPPIPPICPRLPSAVLSVDTHVRSDSMFPIQDRRNTLQPDTPLWLKTIQRPRDFNPGGRTPEEQGASDRWQDLVIKALSRSASLSRSSWDSSHIPLHVFQAAPELCPKLPLPEALGCSRKLHTGTYFLSNRPPSRSPALGSKMAEANVSVAQDQFSCSVCLETLKDPVSLPCGHSYCMGCIKSHWDQDDRTGVYSCPQCRQTFSPRPVLGRNTLLAEVVEKLRKRGSSTPLPPPAHSPAGPGDVLCDFCSRRKMRAVKSCLVCLASYCQTHLQPHYEAPAFKKHRLTSVSRHLQEICPDHQKLREVYCRTDQTCVCLLCSDKDHRSHDTVSTETERAEKQKQLGATQRQTQQRLEEREKELQELRQAVESLRSSGRRAVEDSERVFNELVRSVLRLGSQVKEQIEAGEREAVGQTERHIEELEQEIAELRRRDAELSQLSHTEDHIHFLQTFQALSSLWPGVSRKAPVSAESTFGAVRRLVSELKELTEDLCRQILVRIADAVKIPQPKPPAPPGREEFLKRRGTEWCHRKENHTQNGAGQDREGKLT